MMSFLKSILSSRTDESVDLEQKLEEAAAKIAALEEEVEAINGSIASLGICVVSVASAVRDLAEELQTLANVLNIPLDSKDARTNRAVPWRNNKSDDDYIN